MPQKVSIYTTPTCVYCKGAKEFFKQHNIAYEEFDVAKDLAKRKEMVDKSKQLGVPVITIDELVIVGFNQPKLQEVLGVK